MQFWNAVMASTVAPPLQCCSPLSWASSFQGSAIADERVSLRSTRWCSWPAHGTGCRAVISADNRMTNHWTGSSCLQWTLQVNAAPYESVFALTPNHSRSDEPLDRTFSLAQSRLDSAKEGSSLRPERTNWREAWKLADGDSQNHWRLRRGERPPLSDDGARRVIKERETYERALRKTRVPEEKLPKKWISRTPEQMKSYVADNKWQWRWKRRYTRPVEGAIAAVRQTSSLPPEDVDMRQVMKPYSKELGFRDMCVILKEQRGWRQARLFFEWMKLQIPYNPSVIAYTILLGIYGQAGKLTLAEETLSEMLDVGVEPDEVAAGCMLEAYARWDRLDTVLEFYEAMRQRGLVPSPHVYRTMIVGLYRAGRYSNAVMLWEDFLVEKLEPNFTMYAIIIHVLNKEGRMEEAVLTFKDMRTAGHVPDESLYNTVICILGKLGRYKDAESYFLEMKKQGIEPSKYTYTTMINVWSRAGRFTSASETLAEMQKMGCVPDEVVYCSIINMYGKAGLYEEAEKVFQETAELGLLSHEKTYTSMAKVRADAGRYEEALKLFDSMAEQGLLTTRMAWNTLLHCFVGAGDVEQATKVYSDMVESGSANVVTYGIMINLYSKFQMLVEAENLQIEMRESGVKPDAYIYGTLVKLYCKSDMIDEAAMVVQEMMDDGLVPDQIIKTNLIQAYGSAGRYDEAVQLFQSLQDPDVVAVNSILTMQDTVEGRDDLSLSQSLHDLTAPIDSQLLINQLLIRRAEAGELREAEVLHDKLLGVGACLDDRAAALMIDLYGRRGFFPKAKSLFVSLQQMNNPPSLYVHNAMFKICIACKELDEALSILDKMEETGSMFDAVTISILVSACTKEGRYKDAAEIMKRARKAGVTMDTVAYNTMMKANVKSGNLKGALDIYTEMKEAHVKPVVQTYTILISLFSKLGDLEKASQAFEVILSSEGGADEIAYSQMIHCFGSAGKPQDAANVFREMELRGYQPNEVIYNNLLDAYARAGCFQEARLLLSDMRRRGCPPTSVTYLLLISAYAANGKAADAESVLHLMQNPDYRHYNEVIRAYGNLGNISDACRVFSEMKAAGVEPELGCLRTLLKIHLDHGKFEQGLLMFKELSASFTLDQNLYGIVVDLCTGAERHAEADQWRAELEEKGFVYRSQRQGPPRITVPSIWRRSDHHASVVTDDAASPVPELSHSA